MKIKLLHISLFLFSVFLISCSDSEEHQKDTRTIFKYNDMAGISSLDPAAAKNFENIWAINQLYNGLVEMDDSLNVKPSIAKSWEIVNNGKTYIFHLRSDVFFHDHKYFENGNGRKVNANDFVYSFNRLLDPKVSSATSLLSNINNEHQSAFEAVNDSTFAIHLEKPFTPFLGILTMKYFSVIPKEVVERTGEDFRRNPVGTGPFKFKMWEEGSKLVFVKNENYFEYEGKDRLPYLDAVSISFIKDKETSFLEFMENRFDMVSGIDAINTDQVLTPEGVLKDSHKDKIVMQTQPFLKTDYLGFLIDEKTSFSKKLPFTIKNYSSGH